MVKFIVKCRKVIVTDVEIDTTNADDAREIVLSDIEGHMSNFEPTTVTHLISAIYRRDAEYDHSSNRGRKNNPDYVWKKSKSPPKGKIPYAGKTDHRGFNVR